jgi:hypothetical protein
MAREEGGAIGGVRGEDRDAFIDGLMREMRFFQRSAVVIVDDGPTTPGPVGPDGDRLADLVGRSSPFWFISSSRTSATSSSLTLSRGSSFPIRSRFLLQCYEVRLSVGTVPPSTRSVLQTSALRARSG